MPIHIVRKRVPTEGELVDFYSHELPFLEDFTSLEGHEDGEPTRPYLYQARIVTDPARFMAVRATRQGGKSAGLAMRAFTRSILHRRLRGMPPQISVFVSWNLDDDKEKMRYVRMLHDSLPLDFRPRLIVDRTLEIEFDNGARIVCMHRPRGKGPADVYVDEAAYIKDLAEVRRGALGMVTRGGSIVITSTPAGKVGWFWELFDPEMGHKNTRWKRVTIYWWECPDLCTNVKRALREAPKMATEDRVEKFGTEILRDIFDSMPVEDFRQEYETEFVDETHSYFPYDLLLANVDKGLKVGAEDPARRLYSTPGEFGAAKVGDAFGGFDVGRTINRSELSLVESVGDVLWQRYMSSHHNTPFPEQEQIIRDAIIGAGLARMRVDATGIGMQLGETMAAEFGAGVAEAVNFSSPEKNRMATACRMLLEQTRFRMVGDRERLRHWHSIRAERLAGGGVRYEPPKSEKHHADKFWADALAIRGALDCAGVSGFGVETGAAR